MDMLEETFPYSSLSELDTVNRYDRYFGSDFFGDLEKSSPLFKPASLGQGSLDQPIYDSDDDEQHESGQVPSVSEKLISQSEVTMKYTYGMTEFMSGKTRDMNDCLVQKSCGSSVSFPSCSERDDILPPLVGDKLSEEKYNIGDLARQSSTSATWFLNSELNGDNTLSTSVCMMSNTDKDNISNSSEQSSDSDTLFHNPELNQENSLPLSVARPSRPPLFEKEAINYSSFKEVLQAEPPEWLPDSFSVVCMQCNSPFTAITRGRHHCRFCGGIFCGDCTKKRCLLPVKFRKRDPQRVCDVCYERIDPLQSILINSVSNATQFAKLDVTDGTCIRGWFNSPLGLSMEHEIYKALNSLKTYCQVARLNPEKSIPWSVLKGARGLAILTVVKGGALLTYKFGSGLVVSRKPDGSWSAPSAILSVGLGWGAQIGAELMDFIIVLHGSKAMKAFTRHFHFSLGAGLSAAAGPVGRVLEADIRTSEEGYGMCYTYSCSKGVFAGVSLEGNLVFTRMDTNSRFYGNPSLSAKEILLGTVERPNAAAPLYTALDELYSKVKDEL